MNVYLALKYGLPYVLYSTIVRKYFVWIPETFITSDWGFRTLYCRQISCMIEIQESWNEDLEIFITGDKLWYGKERIGVAKPKPIYHEV